MHASDSSFVTVGSGLIDQEIFLSENKLRLYWDRISDLPDKVKGGIEVIRYQPDTPSDVLAWLKKNIKRLRHVFESAKSGIPLRMNGDPVKIRL